MKIQNQFTSSSPSFRAAQAQQVETTTFKDRIEQMSKEEKIIINECRLYDQGTVNLT